MDLQSSYGAARKQKNTLYQLLLPSSSNPLHEWLTPRRLWCVVWINAGVSKKGYVPHHRQRFHRQRFLIISVCFMTMNEEKFRLYRNVFRIIGLLISFIRKCGWWWGDLEIAWHRISPKPNIDSDRRKRMNLPSVSLSYLAFTGGTGTDRYRQSAILSSLHAQGKERKHQMKK